MAKKVTQPKQVKTVIPVNKPKCGACNGSGTTKPGTGVPCDDCGGRGTK